MSHTKTPWTWINADHKKSRLGHLFGDGDMILDTPDFIYGEPANAAFIVKACNNHKKLIKANKILLMALKFALDNGGFYPDGADFLSKAYDEAIKAAQE